MRRPAALVAFWPAILFTAVSFIMFLPGLVHWGVFVGDSDRMNHSLTALNAYREGFARGQIRLWNESLFGGYSLAALPYDFPNPIALLAAILHTQNIYSFAVVEDSVLSFLSGLAAYAFIRSSGRSRLAACVGGILYQTCALSIVKLTQGDMTFLVNVLTPIVMLIIRQSAKKATAGLYGAFVLVISILLIFTFLQAVAYIALVAVFYALWLALTQRSWRPIWFGLAAGIPALIIAFPRLATVAQDFIQGNRMGGGSNSYAPTGISLVEILRWFDDRIFGASFLEMQRLGISVPGSVIGFNLHEGFLLYATAFTPFLVIYVLVTGLPWRRRDNDGTFCAIGLAIGFSLVMTTAGQWILWSVFFHAEFIHYRALIAFVLLLCTLLALAIDDIGERYASEAAPTGRLGPFYAIVIALAVALGIELIAFFLNSVHVSTAFIGKTRLEGGAVFRIATSAVVLWGLWRIAKRKTVAAPYTHYALATLIITQACAYGAISIWGPGHWQNPAVFPSATRMMAQRGDFQPPTPEALAQVNNRLETAQYRTAFLCPPDQVAVHCETHIANFWHLRSMDGYVSSVPERLALLPWGMGLSWRSIDYPSADQINWSLEGLLNVKYALMFQPALFTNSIRQNGQPQRELRASDLVIVKNPLPVAPRLFFVRAVKAEQDAAAAANYLFPKNQSNPTGYHPDEISVVEGLPEDRTFANDGIAIGRFDGNTVTVELSPSPHERFLVLNERYDPDWMARADTGITLPILPTNVAMRGVVVPPEIRQIVFVYRPFVSRLAAIPFYVGGIAMAAMVAWALRRRRNLLRRLDRSRV